MNFYYNSIYFIDFSLFLLGESCFKFLRLLLILHAFWNYFQTAVINLTFPWDRLVQALESIMKRSSKIGPGQCSLISFYSRSFCFNFQSFSFVNLFKASRAKA